MLIYTIAEEIWQTISEDPAVSPTLISLYIRENIGVLNNLLSLDYSINPDDSEITPELGENEKAILKQLYILYYYGKKLRDVLSLASSNSVIEVTEAGGTVRLLNKNEIAKTYIAIRKDEAAELDKLVTAYKLNNSNPTQTAGFDGDVISYLPNLSYPRRRYFY